MLEVFKNCKKEPYYIVRNKLILSRYIPDLEVVDLIIDTLLKKNNVIVKYNRGGIFRSLKLLRIDLFLYKLIKHEIEELLGFQISKKESGVSYTLSEINTIGYFLKDFTIQDASDPQMIMSFEDFCLCEINNKDKEYKIISVFEDKYVKYDSVCGVDILLILAIKLYGIKCKKISKRNREMLKIKGTPVIAC